LAGALEVRQIPSEPNKVTARVEGDVGAVDGVLRITGIRVHYDVHVPAGKREAAERALATHEQKCPAATSVRGCIPIAISADIKEGG
jgi:organic hydroperoxide reductase OsmC/OhrA